MMEPRGGETEEGRGRKRGRQIESKGGSKGKGRELHKERGKI